MYRKFYGGPMYTITSKAAQFMLPGLHFSTPTSIMLGSGLYMIGDAVCRTYKYVKLLTSSLY